MDHIKIEIKTGEDNECQNSDNENNKTIQSTDEIDLF